MKLIFGIVAAVILSAGTAFSQKETSGKLSFEDSTLQIKRGFVIMPYNRLIKSAGKVITYGDPLLENHALDVCLLPGKKNIAIEDRYGLAVMDSKTNSIIARWNYNKEKEWMNFMSTYSGITSFKFKNKIFIAWGASQRDDDTAAIMLAEWDGKKIVDVSAIRIDKSLTADKTLPNQVIANTEDGILYLYAVLNGTNQLIKIRFDTKKIVYTVPTGVAPYGICIVHKKAYITNWGGPLVTDTTLENAGTPWGSAYTDPRTGATNTGSLSILDISNGAFINELTLGLHPTAIIKDHKGYFLYITNGNSDYVSIVDTRKEKAVDSIPTGLFSKKYHYYGSSPDALFLDSVTGTLYVANGMDNAVAVIGLGHNFWPAAKGSTTIKGYIPTEAYPSGITMLSRHLYITNLEAKGARIFSESTEFAKPGGKAVSGYTIHRQLASISSIAIPSKNLLNNYTEKVKLMNLFGRTAVNVGNPRKNVAPKPLPERIGEPSLFKHVVYIIKENKTYDEVFGDIAQGRGDRDFCLYGEKVTPNQHRLATDFLLLDNYYASGKSSAEGHQWTDAAMVSDYIEKNVRAWFRSYPHRQADALVYNKNGFIWNNAMDRGKKVRIFGEACLTHYDTKMEWNDIFEKYLNHEPINRYNTTTIARIRPVISSNYPDCDNLYFTDQLRADVFIDEWKKYENMPDDSLPNLLILSLPVDHTEGMAENFPVPEAMVADNDLALGRIVETITHSRFWDSTAIFVTEDDSQSGWDHISSYRTTCQVISPYSRLNKTIHTNYNQTSMVRTIEQILGIPPMNIIDATALPMFDCFGDAKQWYAYSLIPNNIPLNKMNKPLAQLKGKSKYYAKLSADEAFKELDSGKDDMMNKILWFAAKGSEKFPSKKTTPVNK